MAILASQTFDTTPGAITLALGGSGITLSSIIAVMRDMSQIDKVPTASLNDGYQRQFSLNIFTQKIRVPDAVPFNGEKVHVIYKLLTV